MGGWKVVAMGCGAVNAIRILDLRFPLVKAKRARVRLIVSLCVVMAHQCMLFVCT